MYSSFALIFSVLAFLFSVFSFLYFRSYLKRRTAKEHVLSETQDEVNKILRSINEVTERDISLIEERQRNLRSLLSETEKRISVYVNEMEKFKESEAAYAEITSVQQIKVPPAPRYQDLGKNYRLKIESESESVQADPEPVPEEKPSIGEQIISMVQAGFSAPIIASRLDISIDEVEFAVALLERREQRQMTASNDSVK